MPALLTHRRPRWTWPASLGGVALVLLLIVLMPVSWWRYLLMPARPFGEATGREVEPHLRVVELAVVTPPPAFTAAPSDRPPPERDMPAPAPDWWRQAWHGRIAHDLFPGSARPDSVLPPALLALLNSRAKLDLILAAPDSVVEASLWRLAAVRSLTRNDLDDFFTSIARARSYADLKSREAAMFGDFINETVPVTR